MTRRLILLRHGQTAWNAERRIQGQTDSALDELGHAQARAVAPAIASLGPAQLWCSDLARARDTARPVAAATGLEPRYDARLREFALGEREGLTHDEYAAVAPAEFARFRSGHLDAAAGAETTPAVRRRLREVLDDLMGSLRTGQTGVAITHGGAIRVATGAMVGWSEEQFHTLRGLDNCGWVVLEQHAEGTALRLAAYNRTAPATP